MTSPLSGAQGVAVPPPRDGHTLSLRGVAHEFDTSDGPRVALAPLDLDIAPGESLCLVGPSGCGKTTLLRLMAGFLRPTSGALFIGDDEIVAPGRDRAVVFQHPTSLYPWLTVRKNVELGLRLRGVSKTERRQRVEHELERVGLADVADRLPAELSGGMQQRCQIARVLANDPDVMLMDEPFGALDAITRERLQAELRSIWQATQRTIVLITHSVDEAVLLGSRVIVFSPRPGTVVFDEPNSWASSTLPLAAVRAQPAFTEFTARLRATIADGMG